MAKISQHCLDEALTALGKFTQDDLKDYVRDVFNRARSYDDLFGTAAMQKAIKEVNNESLQAFFEDAMIKTNNVNKFNKITSLFKKGVDLTEVILRRHKNLDYNIESAQRAARMRLHSSFYSKLSSEEVDYIIKGKNDIDIARAIDGKAASPTAKAIAERHREYIDSRNAEMVTSNALPLDYINKDRHFRGIHNRSKILSGGASLYQRAESAIKKTASVDTRERWKQVILPKLDLERTFAGTDAMGLDGKIDMGEVDKILTDVYKNIIDGKSNIFTRSKVANDKQALSNLSRRFFEWKDMESFMQYNKQYGYDNYFHALSSDIESTASRVGMAKIFGGNPQSMYNQLKHELFEKDKMKPFTAYKTDLYYNQVSGGNNLVSSPTLATMGSNIRTFSSMAKLGRLAIQSMTDVSNNIMFAKEFGYDYYKAYTDTLGGLFNAMPNEERAYLAKLFRVNVDSHMGYIGKFLDANSTGDITRKVSGYYYHGIGMEALDKGNKISAMHMMAKHLFNISGKAFDDVNEATKKYFGKFNVSKDEWEMLRKKNKGQLFTVDNVDNLTDKEVHELWSKSDKLIPLSDMRTNLQSKIYSMFDTASEDAILTPNAFTKAWCTLGTSPGTLLGEALRVFMQFKAYPIRYMDRYWASFMNADSAQAKLAFAVQMLAASIPMSLASQVLDNAAQGKSMPDVTKMTYPEQLKFSINTVASGVGTLQRVLNPQNQNNNLFSSLLNSPSLQLLSDTTSIPFELFTGNTKGLKKSLKNVASDITPIESFPIIAPMIRKMMGEKAYLQPGQEQYYGA